MFDCSRGVLFSGNANNGANAGLAYANSNNAPSNTNANIGSHLCLKTGLTPDIITKSNDLAPWQNSRKTPKGVGRNAPRIGYRRLRVSKAKQ